MSFAIVCKIVAEFRIKSWHLFEILPLRWLFRRMEQVKQLFVAFGTVVLVSLLWLKVYLSFPPVLLMMKGIGLLFVGESDVCIILDSFENAPIVARRMHIYTP